MQEREDALAEEEAGLDELAAPAPDDNPNEDDYYQHESLESARHRADVSPIKGERQTKSRLESSLTQVYIVSYLIFFSIFGVLARIGLQALTIYPGALVANTDLWANVGGSFIMGVLREDRLLFRRHWREHVQNAQKNAGSSPANSHRGLDTSDTPDQENIMDAARKSFTSARTGIPAYVGLSVGFCGSFTSFASICRDGFLAIANDINTAPISTKQAGVEFRTRPSGDSVMALLAVIILEVGLSIVALTCGAHSATFLARPAEKVPVLNLSRMLNPLIVVLAFGCWLGATLMTIFPTHDVWRGRVLFSIVFAPLGTLSRFQISVHLNKLVKSFPLGTFAANVLGCCVMGMSYDLQMSSAGSAILSCQILQGIIDGFCGALTTVSTWVLELDTLRLEHGYFYGACSIFAGVGCFTVVMGSVKWTTGFVAPTCSV
ncbi:CrcB-like protein-domain-containing protein [Neohortaea acidophila]|uniref:CrcB-like protein-domain-containing protein n=1 Tax=Neohortaea acidophila TaxID=245834 RepID=A0A6A6PES9_9PEZI|nr:CrcB-like protein-domain-containing protein [Neohortaea acidophila]KAF2478432.1 CrcB-like protein-domain-containing protein [Neohortaea acidophila]